MKTTNLKHIAYALLALISLNSCEYVLDDIYDCAINQHPVLSSNQLKNGNVDEFYSDFIYAEVKNSPNDDKYDYHFDVSGSLPNGIEWFVDFRTITFKGIPKRSGHYSFTVELWVEGPLYWNESTNEFDDDLCTSYTKKEYSIIIR